MTRVLLRQLLSQLGTIPNEVINERSRYQKDPHRAPPDQEKCEALLKCSIKQFFKVNKKQIFILLDAYDELLHRKEVKWEDTILDEITKERAAVLSCLSGLIETGNAKVLITARAQYCGELKAAFPASKVVDVYGDLKDMKTYLEDRMRFLPLKKALKDEIMNKVVVANQEEKW